VTETPRPAQVYETALYAHDVAASARFYADVLGLRAIDGPDEHSAAFRLDGGGVLLLFDPRRTSGSGRFVPPHGAEGAGHVAFAVAALDAARTQLERSGVTIEREIEWPRGGRSVYFRDPAGNSVELVEGEIWAP
jgi:catechol 2,3-dioxygenase-like lactoylglutathione lyase family enzyme